MTSIPRAPLSSVTLLHHHLYSQGNKPMHHPEKPATSQALYGSQALLRLKCLPSPASVPCWSWLAVGSDGTECLALPTEQRPRTGPGLGPRGYC